MTSTASRTARATDRRRRRVACSGVRERGGSCWSGTEKSSRNRFRQPHAEEPEKIEDRIAEEAFGGPVVIGIGLSPQHNCAPHELRPEEERSNPVNRPSMAEHVG